MVKTVIVPVDRSARSESALEPGAQLARLFGADLRVMTAVTTAQDPADAAYLDELAGRVADLDVTTDVIPETDAGAAIALVAAESPDPVVCMATHGRRGLGHLTLGSVAEDTLRRVPTPVVLVGPHASAVAATGPVVICWDGSAVGTSILPTATDWARELDRQASVVLVRKVMERPHGELPHDLRDHLDTTVARLRAEGVAAVSEVLVHHDPAEGIVGFAGAQGAALVAASTHGRSGLRRAALGSVAMRIARWSPCPVLVQRALSCEEGGEA